MNIAAIIQARMSSSRLPGKVLLDLEGQPMLGRVVQRVLRASRLNQVAVATTTDPSDEAILAYCQAQGIPCLRGSLHDVLDRYYQAALALQADVVVRITADCPLMDPALIDAALQAFCGTAGEPGELAYDFCANRLPPPWRRTYPIGLDIEICSFKALQRAWSEAGEPFQREHVMPYFYQDLQPPQEQSLQAAYHSPRGFRVLLLNHAPDYGARRWTVDTPEDYRLAQEVYRRFPGRGDFTWQEVLALFEREPALEQINAGVPAKTAFAVDSRRK